MKMERVNFQSKEEWAYMQDNGVTAQYVFCYDAITKITSRDQEVAFRLNKVHPYSPLQCIPVAQLCEGNECLYIGWALQYRDVYGPRQRVIMADFGTYDMRREVICSWHKSSNDLWWWDLTGLYRNFYELDIDTYPEAPVDENRLMSSRHEDWLKNQGHFRAVGTLEEFIAKCHLTILKDRVTRVE